MKVFIVGLLVFIAVLFKYGPLESLGIIKDIEDLEKDFKNSKKVFLIKNIEQLEKDFFLSIENKSSKSRNFIDELYCASIESDVLPSILIAQSAIETGWGRSKTLGFNYFGIKSRKRDKKTTAYTKEWNGKKYITIHTSFQKFTSLESSVARYAEIIKRYDFNGRDYNKGLLNVKKIRYATDPKYISKLKRIIEEYDLHIMDSIQELKINLSLL